MFFSFLISKAGINYLLYKELKYLAHSWRSTNASVNNSILCPFWVSIAVSGKFCYLKHCFINTSYL